MKPVLLLSVFLLATISMNAQGWGQTQKIVPADRSVGQQFGADVDIDGNYAVVGMLPSGNETNVYVFENDGSGNWVQTQKLESPNYHQYNHFGYSVAISGNYIFVGAWGQNYDETELNYLNAAGAAYIFKKNASGLFEFEQKIVASNRQALDAFGYNITLNEDYAVISPVRHHYDVAGNNYLDTAGAAYIFERDSNGIWNEVQKIVASDRAAFDHFGQVSTALDGNYLAIGSYGEDEDENGINTLGSAGSAYIFERDSNGTWHEVQKIVASDRAQGEFFGWSIALDGNHLLVGSNQNNNFTGAAYVFEKNGNDIWNEVQKLTASNGVAGDRFGQDADMDGNRIIIGSHYKDIGNSGDDGAAYIFEKESGVWTETAFIYDAFYSTSEYFGFSVALDEDFALVGTYGEDRDENEQNNLQSAGAAFIFDANEPNTLSVIENTNLSFRAYPNPTEGELIIDLNKHYEEVNISVYNMLGQHVQKNTFHTVQSINLKLDISSGSYFVKVHANAANSTILKIIKH